MKRLLVIMTLFALIGTVCLAATSFYDVPRSHWGYEMIMEMKNDGILNGYEDGSFKPDQEVTREELTQMMLKITNTTQLDLDKIQNYYDVSTDRWSYKAVQAFGSSIKETSDGYTYFYPSRPIQRQEVAKVVSDYYGMKNDNLDSRDSLKLKFNVQDCQNIKLEYADAIYNLYEKGYMKGMSEFEFSPTTSLTRAQAATLLSRINKQITEGTEIVPTVAPDTTVTVPTATPSTTVLVPTVTPATTVIAPTTVSPSTTVAVPTVSPTTPATTVVPSTPAPVKSGVDLDVALIGNREKNLIYSPLSIKYGLKMLSDGAKGDTKTEIDNIVSQYNLTKYTSSKNLSVANAIFVDNDYKNVILSSYTNKLKNSYDAEVKFDSFDSAKNVNDWIKSKTFSLIVNMFADSDFDKDTRLVLVNTAGIDMEWKNQFKKEKTAGADFTKIDGSKIQAETMFETVVYPTIKTGVVVEYNDQGDAAGHGVATLAEPDRTFGYYVDNNVQVYSRELKKYGSTTLEFVAIMPKNEKLSDYTASVKTSDITSLIANLKHIDDGLAEGESRKVTVSIPKFTYIYNINLANELKKFGVEKAFSNVSADFTNMYDKSKDLTKSNLCVGKAKHKAKIEFSEEGIKAAAATGIEMIPKGIELTDENIVLDFDRPFMYVIRDKSKGDIWFIGTVYEPTLHK